MELPEAHLEDVLALRRAYNHDRQPGDCALGIEYLGAHGHVIEYFWAQPGARLKEDERLEGQPLDSIKLFQTDDGSWQLQLRAEGSQTAVCYGMEETLLEQFLANAEEKLYARPPKGQEWHPAEE